MPPKKGGRMFKWISAAPAAFSAWVGAAVVILGAFGIAAANLDVNSLGFKLLLAAITLFVVFVVLGMSYAGRRFTAIAQRLNSIEKVVRDAELAERGHQTVEHYKNHCEQLGKQIIESVRVTRAELYGEDPEKDKPL